MILDMPKKQAFGHHVEFISYDGKYPYLCYGKLTLLIDGRIVTFGCTPDCDYPRFWITGGRHDKELTKGEWLISCHVMPKQFVKYVNEIDRAMNDNIEYGCCGGCLL